MQLQVDVATCNTFLTMAAPAACRSWEPRRERVRRDGRHDLGGRRPPLVRSRPAGRVQERRHGVLLGACGSARFVARRSFWCVCACPVRCDEPHPGLEHLGCVRTRRNALARRAVQDVRRARQWLRARRGRGRRFALDCTGRRGARGARATPRRVRRALRWQEREPHRSQRLGAGEHDPGGAHGRSGRVARSGGG